ncbi:hypothetical protein [Lyngbya aestuarii]|uniref:hypothetical protein n=1 Tax=Lyngbya aestuarii TaxID=118322 RepID=UPI00403D6F58
MKTNTKTRWKNVCFKLTTWLVTEIILNLLGLDDLADYGEFVFDPEVIIATTNPQLTVVVPPHYPRLNHELPCPYTIGTLV